MKLLKGLLYTAVILVALAAFGWFFVSQLSTGPARSDEPAGVLLSAPPGYSIVERGELSPSAAATELEGQVLHPDAGKVGIRFKRQGSEVYWLADPAGDVLEERSAGASGTRLQTVWHGGIRERLSWARAHGSFDAPGLSPAERKNLYH
ncbi:MAG TPA: hypothetical protein VEW48_02915 [Thermoanaerobaculia bacterium]|nr:hypothetical protein [Thermoanaerobaculia bacterium]